MLKRVDEDKALRVLKSADPQFLHQQLKVVMELVDETTVGSEDEGLRNLGLIRLSLLSGLEEFLSALLDAYKERASTACQVCRGLGMLVNGVSVIRCERCLVYESQAAAFKAAQEHAPDGMAPAKFLRELRERE